MIHCNIAVNILVDTHYVTDVRLKIVILNHFPELQMRVLLANWGYSKMAFV